MSVTVNSTKQSTKDLIIKAAFSFYTKPVFKDFSMSQLAEKVGVTKTAIYRHFVNKEAIAAEMEKYFFDMLGSRLVKIQSAEKNGESAEATEEFRELICFFSETPEYVNFFINKFNTDRAFEQTMREQLVNRGVRDEFEDYYRNNVHGNLIKKYAHGFYCGISLLFFIKAKEKIAKEKGLKVQGIEFADKVIAFVRRGFKNSVKPDSILYPSEISEKRMKELDELSRLEEDDLPEENRIFKAFAAVIKKYGMNGVTVEHIAGELNMAKSSLYFYFENKNQMISSLLGKELDLLRVICRENAVEARNYTEYQYITMRTELNYFLRRKSVIPICGWLLQTGTSQSFFETERDEIGNIWEKKLPHPLTEIDLGFPVMPELLSFWAGVLPVVLVIMKVKHNMSEQEIGEAFKYTFEFVTSGVTECNCRK
jgi:AcrR family transcriptional regulator